MRSAKGQIKERIELPNQNARRKGKLQVIGNIGDGQHQTSGDGRKIRNEYLRRTRKLLETKLCSRNVMKGINSWKVSFVWYSGPFLKWTREELRQMDQRTRKLMMMYKALHPIDDIDRLHVSRKEWGWGPASIEDSVNTLIRKSDDYT